LVLDHPRKTVLNVVRLEDVPPFCIDRAEHGIAPPMGTAITIPITGAIGVTIYVCTPAFGPVAPDDILAEIAERLELAEEESPYKW
jgi:hypothetical protein